MFCLDTGRAAARICARSCPCPCPFFRDWPAALRRLRLRRCCSPAWPPRRRRTCQRRPRPPVPSPGSVTRRTSSTRSPTPPSLRMEAVPIGVTKPQRGYLGRRQPGGTLRLEGAAAAAARRLQRKLQGRNRRLSPRPPARHAHGAASRRTRASTGASAPPCCGSRTPSGWNMDQAGPGPGAALVAAGQPHEALRPAHCQHRPQPGQPAL